MALLIVKKRKKNIENIFLLVTVEVVIGRLTYVIIVGMLQARELRMLKEISKQRNT